MLLDHAAAGSGGAAAARAAHDIARVRLMCLVRSGDGYVVRAAGRLAEAGETRRHLDITFGDAAGSAHSAELDAAVRQVLRWCEEGTTVALIEGTAGLALRAGDGTEIALPQPA